MCISVQLKIIHSEAFRRCGWLNVLSCVCVCQFTAVISAHPIHSLDNHHHHYHTGSLASPTRSYLQHQQSSAHLRPHACATPISYLDRVDSTGETLTRRMAGQMTGQGPSAEPTC